MRPRAAFAVDAALALLLAGGALFLALSPIWEADVYFHVAIGRWILEHHALPRHDLWSAVDPARAYVPPHWLFDAVAARLDRLGGLEAVRVAVAAFIAACFAAFYVVVRRLGQPPLRALVLGVALLVAFHARMRPRPHVVNLAVEIGMIAWVARLRAARLWHALPVAAVFFVWSCMHDGAAWLGVAALATLAFAALALDRSADAPERRRLLLVVTLAAGVGWLLNPAALASLAAFNFGELGGLGEWRHWPAAGETAFGAYWLVTRAAPPLALALWIAAVRRVWPARQGAVAYELVLAGFFVALSFWAMRFFYLAVLAIVLVEVSRPRAAAPSRRATVAMAAAVVALFAVTLRYEAAFYPSLVRSRAETIDERFVPVVLTRLLVESGIEARVATLPNWGSYLLYQAWPQLTVTVDGRNNAREDVMALTHELERIRPSDPEGAALPRAYSTLPADFVLMPGPVFRDGDTGEWLKVASMPPGELWVRRGERTSLWLTRLAQVAARHRAAR